MKTMMYRSEKGGQLLDHEVDGKPVYCKVFDDDQLKQAAQEGWGTYADLTPKKRKRAVKKSKDDSGE